MLLLARNFKIMSCFLSVVAPGNVPDNNYSSASVIQSGFPRAKKKIFNRVWRRAAIQGKGETELKLARFQVAIAYCFFVISGRNTVLHDHSGGSVADRRKQAKEKPMCFAKCDLAGAQVPAIVYSATYTSMVKQLSGIFKDIAFTG